METLCKGGFNEGYEGHYTDDEKRQFGTVQEAVRSHVLEVQSPLVNAEFCYFDVSPEVVSSEKLVFACKDKSKEISESKRHSAKPALFSMIYQDIIKPISCEDDMEKFVAKPNLQLDDRFINQVTWTPTESTARKILKKTASLKGPSMLLPFYIHPRVIK